MLFNSIEFLVFFAATLILHFAIPHRWRWVLLLAASYYFYMSWKWQYGFLILFVSLVNYYFGNKIAETESPRRRALLLTVCVGLSLGVLFYYKYAAFAAASVGDLARLLGFDAGAPKFEVFLPVGISFFTFQALTYSIDIYRRKMAPRHHVGKYLLYVAFFPQLVAGPIERASRLLAQFDQEMHLRPDDVTSGLKLMLWGMFKKVVIADRLAIFVNLVYGSPESYSGPTLLLATYFFAFQIYCDFSAYSDIAIGCARALGFNLMQNFNLPYLARSIGDFWSRWHISLSTWFRDYVYIPMGGNRVSLPVWVFNIMATFLLSGLWHGASWNFVIWGGLHGTYYVFGRMTAPLRAAFTRRVPLPGFVWVGLQTFFTLQFVVLSWVFFRASTSSDALLILRRILTMEGSGVYLGGSAVQAALSMSLIVVLLIVQVLQFNGVFALYRSASRCPAWLSWVGYLSLAVAILLLGVQSHAFIYFQF